MRQINFEDIIPLEVYKEKRKEIHEKIVANKKNRRIKIGELITIVFENFETVKYQIQEMLRIENITKKTKHFLVSEKSLKKEKINLT